MALERNEMRHTVYLLIGKRLKMTPQCVTQGRLFLYSTFFFQYSQIFIMSNLPFLILSLKYAVMHTGMNYAEYVTGFGKYTPHTPD